MRVDESRPRRYSLAEVLLDHLERQLHDIMVDPKADLSLAELDAYAELYSGVGKLILNGESALVTSRINYAPNAAAFMKRWERVQHFLSVLQRLHGPQEAKI